eukprot:TRINITY_DN7104_c0_g1_i1.p1 TRINITY_DN7104_c0_g1~~TRINITY_DN7104_c0_g1_i1.p1  ORF type:complete len:371 (+),score=73.18 TRINITY_DN7104_c0_g1_i1:47-1159(+)
MPASIHHLHKMLKRHRGATEMLLVEHSVRRAEHEGRVSIEMERHEGLIRLLRLRELDAIVKEREKRRAQEEAAARVERLTKREESKRRGVEKRQQAEWDMMHSQGRRGSMSTEGTITAPSSPKRNPGEGALGEWMYCIDMDELEEHMRTEKKALERRRQSLVNLIPHNPTSAVVAAVAALAAVTYSEIPNTKPYSILVEEAEAWSCLMGQHIAGEEEVGRATVEKYEAQMRTSIKEQRGNQLLVSRRSSRGSQNSICIYIVDTRRVGNEPTLSLHIASLDITGGSLLSLLMNTFSGMPVDLLHDWRVLSKTATLSSQTVVTGDTLFAVPVATLPAPVLKQPVPTGKHSLAPLRVPIRGLQKQKAIVSSWF